MYNPIPFWNCTLDLKISGGVWQMLSSCLPGLDPAPCTHLEVGSARISTMPLLSNLWELPTAWNYCQVMIDFAGPLEWCPPRPFLVLALAFTFRPSWDAQNPCQGQALNWDLCPPELLAEAVLSLAPRTIWFLMEQSKKRPAVHSWEETEFTFLGLSFYLKTDYKFFGKYTKPPS